MLDHLEELINRSTKRKFSPNGTIYYQGEVPQAACIVRSGIVRVFSISERGDYQTVTYHMAGEFFPSSWIFGKAPATLFFYEAVTECEVAFAPRAELISYMLETPPRMHAMLDYFTSNYSASLIRINALEQSKARDKLLHTLYYLCQRYGTQRGSKYYIPLMLTHQDLGNLVGLTRETTATEMSRLKKEGAVRYDSQKYVINMDKIFELIGEDSLKNVNIALQ